MSVSFAAEDNTTFDRANHYFLAPTKFSFTFVPTVRGTQP
jgi:hypothetical protein